MTNKKTFDISVIIPIYNTAEYLDETIESVIKQTLGFREHIQLILINDGSTDGSEEICLKYQKEYPDNIIYKYKENGGVSSACNIGKEYAEGLFVNFMGSDDKWTKETFKSVYKLIKEDKEKKTDVISTKLIYFDDLDIEDLRNYQYDKTRIVDLTQKDFYRYSQITFGNCFVRNEAVKKYSFDEKLDYMEDTLYLNTILLDKCTVGLVSEAVYYVRKRKELVNLSSLAIKKKTRYLVTPRRCFMRLFELSREKYDQVIPYIQHSVMYDMQWRFGECLPQDMTDDEIEEYENTLKELLRDVDDDTIASQPTLHVRDRVYIFKMKHGNDFFENATWKNGRAYYNNRKIYTLLGTNRLYWMVMETSDTEIILKGVTDIGDLELPFKIWIQDENGVRYHADIESYPPKDIMAFNRRVLSKGMKVEVRVPKESGKKYSFYVQVGDNKPYEIKSGFGWDAKLNHFLKNSYWCCEDHIFKLINGRICVYDYRKRTHIVSELRYMRDVVTFKRGAKYKHENLTYFSYRLLYYLCIIFGSKKEKWLIMDREKNATDNGAALFKYAKKIKDKSRDIVFALDRDSLDYEELKRYGKIIKPNSLRYKMRFLTSDIFISSHADDWLYNPFLVGSFLIKDLRRGRFVYLQHGIMQGELTNWLNELTRNIKLLVTSTAMETEKIVNGSYGYSEQTVKLLGSPRFDPLFEYSKRKKVVIMPTWRLDLAGPLVSGTRERKYVSDFKNTNYCRFYNSLISNPRLIKTVKDMGYECEFYVHPMFGKQVDDFDGNETVRVIKKNAEYERVLGEAAVLITDYSGIQFDFAYQMKPLIYSHFDDLYTGVWGHNHTYQKPYFDYDTDGFGPIAHTVEEVVDELIKVLANNGEMTNFYKKRVSNFFFYHDDKNSERIYNAICSIRKTDSPN